MSISADHGPWRITPAPMNAAWSEFLSSAAVGNPLLKSRVRCAVKQSGLSPRQRVAKYRMLARPEADTCRRRHNHHGSREILAKLLIIVLRFLGDAFRRIE
jgi:hypothetical protein